MMSDPVKLVHDQECAEALERLQRRSRDVRRRFYQQQPKRAANVMADLVQRRGYACERIAADWEQAWKTACGEKWEFVTKVGRFRRGVLEIHVVNSLAMQELGFEKELLIAELKRLMPEMGVQSIRLRIGT